MGTPNTMLPDLQNAETSDLLFERAKFGPREAVLGTASQGRLTVHDDVRQNPHLRSGILGGVAVALLQHTRLLHLESLVHL